MLKAATALALLRHAIQLCAGLLVMYGVIDEGMQEQVIGVGMSIGSMVWFLWEKKRNADKPDQEISE